jgi:hypothetical protein
MRREIFFLQNSQIGAESNPTSYSMDSGVLSLGVKRADRVIWTSHFHLEPRQRLNGAIPVLPPLCLPGVGRGKFIKLPSAYVSIHYSLTFDMCGSTNSVNLLKPSGNFTYDQV